ncbi:MAG: VWA domain-containing protein [Acidobacteriota bacterium]
MKPIRALLPIRIPLFLLAVVLLCVPTAFAQSDEDPAFGEIIDVRVINLEVVVTDGKDRVHGLQADDFRVRVNGQEIPIEYFTEVQGGQATTGTALADASTLPALAPGEAVGTRYLVFIDEVFAIRSQRNRVLRKLSEQLPYLGPEDHMAIVAYNGGELDLLTSWTSSQPALARVLKAAQQRRTFGLQNRVTRDFDLARYDYFRNRTGDRFFGRDPFFNRFGAGFPDFSSVARRGSRTFNDTAQVIDAANSVLRAFAKPPGRKVMLMLSGGWPVGAGGGFTSSVGYSGGASDRSALRPLIDTANRLGYTLYPVDVKGLENNLGGGAEFSTSRSARLFNSFARNQEFVEEGTLLYLAEETGGRALLDGSSTKALQRVAEDTRSYYWIGFTPTWEQNDRRHRVKVDVLRKGLKVRSRNSFSDLSRQTEVSMLVESAQTFNLPIPGETARLEISTGTPEKGGFRKVILPLKLTVPLEEVTLLPTQNGYAARLELRVAATDDRGNKADIPVIPLELRGEGSEVGEFANLEVKLKLRKRPHQLLISLHDPTSGNLISKRFDLTL